MPFKQRTKFIPVVDASGKKTGNFVCVNDSRVRWRALFWWCVIFTLVVFFVLSKYRQQAEDLKNSKADVTQLKIGNCNARLFIVSSAKARLRSAANHENAANEKTGADKRKEKKAAKADRASAKVAMSLADNFAPPGCEKALGIKSENPLQVQT